MDYKYIVREEWDNALEKMLLSHNIFASVEDEFGMDYELIRAEDICNISYNKPKPATSLKTFFLPVSENVTFDRSTEKPRIILGIPNCDIEGLSLLDEIYLDKEFNDLFYRIRRENTILISTDCLGIKEHCHCLSYNIKPYATRNADLCLISLSGTVFLGVITEKGENFLEKIETLRSVEDKSILAEIEKEHLATEAALKSSGINLPDSIETGILLNEAKDTTWEKYSSRCVSCGACNTICPTCSCFLLIDKPGFEKIKQTDACQYPGFERVAGGEDALFELHNRFKNRYMCKYVWKAEKFSSLACTGCGRCIEACIGKINKNEIFIELENNR